MALYYFDTSDGEVETVDQNGIQCESLRQVEQHAVRALPEIARDELPNGPTRTFWVRVRDAEGQAIFEASLAFTSRWLHKD